MIANYERIHGTKPKQVHSPLMRGDHPDLDDSELLGFKATKIHQSLIGALQWVAQIGRFDVGTTVMTLSRFHAAPCSRHLDQVKRIHGFLSKFRFWNHPRTHS